MTNEEERRAQSYRRVPAWTAAHPAILQAAPAPVQVHLNELVQVVTRIEANAVTQAVSHQRTTRDATDATLRRNAVRSAMQPITQVARELRGTVFGISAISKMPKDADNERLVTAANSMVENAIPFKDALIAHGLQPDCIESLQTAAAALKSSIDARGLAKTQGVGATKGIRVDVLAGRKLVSLIDAGLKPQLRNDPALRASWENAKRVTTKGVVGVITPLTVPPVAAPSTTPVATTAATHAA